MTHPRRVDLADAAGTVVRRDVPVRQCPEGLDASPSSVAHDPHLWTPDDNRSDADRWCRGWFPLVTASRAPIRFASVRAVQR